MVRLFRSRHRSHICRRHLRNQPVPCRCGGVFARHPRHITAGAARNGIDGRHRLVSVFYRGTGKARGLEVLAQRKAGRHTGWASYTLSRVTYDFPDLGAPFVADHDRNARTETRRHVQFDRWTLSGTWIVSTGTPYTEPVGTTATPIESPFGTLTVERIDVEKRRQQPAELSPAGCGGKLHLAAWRRTAQGTIGVSVFNAYNRQNVWDRSSRSLRVRCREQHRPHEPDPERVLHGEVLMVVELLNAACRWQPRLIVRKERGHRSLSRWRSHSSLRPASCGRRSASSLRWC